MLAESSLLSDPLLSAIRCRSVTKIVEAQRIHTPLMKQWEETFPIQSTPTPVGPVWRDITQKRLVIPPDGEIK